MAFILPVIIVVGLAMAALLRPWPLFPPDNSEVLDNRTVAPFFTWLERLAKRRGLKVRGVALSLPEKCPKCAKESNYFVYPDEICERCWSTSLQPKSSPFKETRV